MIDHHFLDLLERALRRADARHFVFDELRYEVERRRWNRPDREDAAFYSLARDALTVGLNMVSDWERHNYNCGRACVRPLLDRLEWELRFREMAVLVGRRVCA